MKKTDKKPEGQEKMTLRFARAGKTAAVHAQHENEHLVAFGSLRVLVKETNSHWFAQGIEVDYAAAGDSLEDVKDRFEKGLTATIHLHLERYGTIEKLLRFAPKEALEPFGDIKNFHTLTSVSLHICEEHCEHDIPVIDAFRFPTNVQYLQVSAH